jgi:RNA polymerase sigma-70 factor (ECF subfamily)
LLARLRARGDRQAWALFEELYRPLVVGFARAKHLQDADAQDIWQEVLFGLNRVLDHFVYDSSGSFAAWLRTIALNKIRDAARRGVREIPGTGRTSIQELLKEQPDTEEVEEFDREYFRRRLEWAAGKVQGQFQEQTFAAFWETAVEGHPATLVAQRLGISANAVRIAKARVLMRVKAYLDNVWGDNEGGSQVRT